MKGNLMGEDYFGNKFYEIPADPKTGKSKTSRWVEAVDKEDHMQEMAAEWESWLRGRRYDLDNFKNFLSDDAIIYRKLPPTDQELMKNLAIMNMKKKNAALIDDKLGRPQDHAALKKDETGEKAAFPKYGDYEAMPGEASKGSKS